MLQLRREIMIAAFTAALVLLTAPAADEPVRYALTLTVVNAGRRKDGPNGNGHAANHSDNQGWKIQQEPAHTEL